MQFRAAFRTLFSSKASEAGAIVSEIGGSQARYTPVDYGKLSRQGYAQCVIAFRCIDLIARSAASVPLLLYRRTSGDPMEVTDHPILDLLARPNPKQSGFEVRVDASAYLLISGNSYLEKVGPSNREPRELYAHRPDRMKVLPGKFGLPKAFEYTVGGKSKRWDVDPVSGRGDILQVRTFNPIDDWYGLGPIQVAARAVDQHNAADDHNLALLQNGARLSGLLSFEGDAEDELSPEQAAKIEEQILAKFNGPKKAGKILFSGAGGGKFTWTEMGLSPKDMDWLLAKTASASDTCNAFGVPQQLVGIQSAQTFSNMREARLWLYEETVLPHLGHVLDGLNSWLCPVYGDDLYLAYDEDRISALGPRRERAWERVQNADFLTLNEKREAVGYEPIDGGEALLVPATMLPLGDTTGDDEDEPKDADADNLIRLTYGDPAGE